tara:strand:+ start:3262 stop:4599 length:1338 start_codon:yes stop_codon:yes gene_type:complete
MSSVKLHEIEPVYYQANQRVEFRLQPDKLYSTDVIVANLGVSKAANPSPLHKWNGVGGVITRCTLFDGNTELSKIDDVGFWNGWKQITKGNQYATSVAPYLNGSNQSHHYNNTDDRTNQTLVAPLVAKGMKIGEGITRSASTQVAELNTYRGQVRLRQIFDLLLSVPYIDTSVFKNFRIVCELSNVANRVIKSQQTTSDLTTSRPLLVLHEVIDEDVISGMMGKMGNVMYTEIETDSVIVPAVTGMTNASRYVAQEQNYHINAFDNKTLGRMLLWKQPQLSTNVQDTLTGGTQVGNGIYSSSGFLGEQEQIRINGRNVYARSGLSGSNRRLAHVVDTWGDYALAPFKNGLAYYQVDAQSRQDIIDNGNGEVGTRDWVAVDLANEKCMDLQIDFRRRGLYVTNDGAGGDGGTALSKHNASHNLQIWCEVRKAIVPMKGGGYNVVYL